MRYPATRRLIPLATKKLRGYARDHQSQKNHHYHSNSNFFTLIPCCMTIYRLTVWNHSVKHPISKFKDEKNLSEFILGIPKGPLKCTIILHSQLPNILFHTAKLFSADMDFWVKPSGNSSHTKGHNLHWGSFLLSLPHLYLASFPSISTYDS